MTEFPISSRPVDAQASLAPRGRLSLRLLQIGAIAVILVATLHRNYELDRFLVPKELVLNLTAFLAGFLALRLVRDLSFRRIDLLLALYFVVSAVSAALATNEWLGFRALAVTASTILLFLVARALSREGHQDAIVTTVSFAVTLATATALLQTYGLEIDLFSINRAPGGTLGNRNFIGHIAAFGLPVLLVAALRARGVLAHLIGAVGVFGVTAALVLTRSRAAWVATAAVLAVFFVAFIASRAIRTSGRVWLRTTFLAIVAVGSIAAALMIPNTLDWRSENPYLDSVRGVASYDEGSGRGRLIQYERSLRMMLSRPILGVGPGNWPVEYADFAVRRDPSLDPSEDGTTYNPWPSSDWIAFLSERGLAGGGLIIAIAIAIAVTGLRQARVAAHPDEALRGTALVATLVGASVAGLFDAVLLLGAPALLVWSVLGALYPEDGMPASQPEKRAGRMKVAGSIFAVALVLVSFAGSVRSAAQIAAMELHSRGSRESLRLAARLDPANYRVRVELADRSSGKQRCLHGLAASSLFPNAARGRRLSRGCD